MKKISKDNIWAKIEATGHSDAAYFHSHSDRFLQTLAQFEAKKPEHLGHDVLDIGAHWLHQAVLWRTAGYHITAVDIPSTFLEPSVQQLAENEHITLLPCEDFAAENCLSDLASESFDIILFTEIIGHITFNTAFALACTLSCTQAARSRHYHHTQFLCLARASMAFSHISNGYGCWFINR